MENIKFSVIIPVYNVENYLKECLDSIFAYKGELEVIAVDDGSTDSSGKMLDEYMDERLKVFHKENEGVFKTWQYGVKKSTGEYIIFVDADDWMDSGMICAANKILSERPFDLIQFSWESVFCNSRQKNSVTFFPDEELEGEKLTQYLKKHFFDFEGEMYYQYRWSKVFRAELLKEILPVFEGETFYLFEDFTSVLYYLTKIKSLRNVSDVYYHYRNDRVGSESNSHSKAELFYHDTLCSLNFLNKNAGGGGLYTSISYEKFYKRNLITVLSIAGNSGNVKVMRKILKDPLFRQLIRKERGFKYFLWKHGMARSYLSLKRIRDKIKNRN